MTMNWEQMGAMMWQTLRQELNKLPPEAQQALQETGIYISRDERSILLDARINEGDASAQKARDVLLDTLIPPLSKIIKGFGCRVFIKNEVRGGQEC